ncbi:CoA-binding protein [Belliella sp. DSM 111904]|uniref:CoA-binding protein n=1 Tax=Belliella filtrata TaxID=2923435 RepID=A0ABS9UWD7_9BACT|nr:CoA-binding protein [Belliella filtrata]MCH7408468.1 CoA-binding protein [Belliella filtrata]
MKKTLIVGATTNPSRYAYLAAELLGKKGQPFVPIGIKTGNLFGQDILDLKAKPQIEDLDTITLYIGPQHQEEWYDYLLGLKPSRIIFNPGTENPIFEMKAAEKGIEVAKACTLVLLSTGQY